MDSLSLTRDPSPRVLPQIYSPHAWRAVSTISLPKHEARLAALDVVLSARRSTRKFGRLTIDLLSQILWLSSHCQRTTESGLGFCLQQRPLPSAGAIHPVHLLINVPGVGWARYNATSHSLELLDVMRDWSESLAKHCNELVPIGDGALMLFVAEPGMTAAKYDACESLIWRDAGILQGGLSIVAAGVGCNMCLLGITGNPWAQKLSEQGQLTGVGAAILGS